MAVPRATGPSNAGPASGGSGGGTGGPRPAYAAPQDDPNPIVFTGPQGTFRRLVVWDKVPADPGTGKPRPAIVNLGSTATVYYSDRPETSPAAIAVIAELHLPNGEKTRAILDPGQKQIQLLGPVGSRDFAGMVPGIHYPGGHDAVRAAAHPVQYHLMNGDMPLGWRAGVVGRPDLEYRKDAQGGRPVAPEPGGRNPFVGMTEDGDVRRLTDWNSITYNKPRRSSDFLGAIMDSNGVIYYGDDAGVYHDEIQKFIPPAVIRLTLDLQPKSVQIGSVTDLQQRVSRKERELGRQLTDHETEQLLLPDLDKLLRAVPPGWTAGLLELDGYQYRNAGGKVVKIGPSGPPGSNGQSAGANPPAELAAGKMPPEGRGAGGGSGSRGGNGGPPRPARAQGPEDDPNPIKKESDGGNIRTLRFWDRVPIPVAPGDRLPAVVTADGEVYYGERPSVTHDTIAKQLTGENGPLMRAQLDPGQKRVLFLGRVGGNEIAAPTSTKTQPNGRNSDWELAHRVMWNMFENGAVADFKPTVGWQVGIAGRPDFEYRKEPTGVRPVSPQAGGRNRIVGAAEWGDIHELVDWNAIEHRRSPNGPVDLTMLMTRQGTIYYGDDDRDNLFEMDASVTKEATYLRLTLDKQKVQVDSAEDFWQRSKSKETALGRPLTEAERNLLLMPDLELLRRVTPPGWTVGLRAQTEYQFRNEGGQWVSLHPNPIVHESPTGNIRKLAVWDRFEADSATAGRLPAIITRSGEVYFGDQPSVSHPALAEHVSAGAETMRALLDPGARRIQLLGLVGAGDFAAARPPVGADKVRDLTHWYQYDALAKAPVGWQAGVTGRPDLDFRKEPAGVVRVSPPASDRNRIVGVGFYGNVRQLSDVNAIDYSGERTGLEGELAAIMGRSGTVYYGDDRRVEHRHVLDHVPDTLAGLMLMPGKKSVQLIFSDDWDERYDAKKKELGRSLTREEESGLYVPSLEMLRRAVPPGWKVGLDRNEEHQYRNEGGKLVKLGQTNDLADKPVPPPATGNGSNDKNSSAKFDDPTKRCTEQKGLPGCTDHKDPGGFQSCEKDPGCQPKGPASGPETQCGQAGATAFCQPETPKKGPAEDCGAAKTSATCKPEPISGTGPDCGAAKDSAFCKPEELKKGGGEECRGSSAAAMCKEALPATDSKQQTSSGQKTRVPYNPKLDPRSPEFDEFAYFDEQLRQSRAARSATPPAPATSAPVSTAPVTTQPETPVAKPQPTPSNGPQRVEHEIPGYVPPAAGSGSPAPNPAPQPKPQPKPQPTPSNGPQPVEHEIPGYVPPAAGSGGRASNSPAPAPIPDPKKPTTPTPSVTPAPTAGFSLVTSTKPPTPSTQPSTAAPPTLNMGAFLTGAGALTTTGPAITLTSPGTGSKPSAPAKSAGPSPFGVFGDFMKSAQETKLATPPPATVAPSTPPASPAPSPRQGGPGGVYRTMY